jgi:GGDEF domain-containing protein
MRDEAGVIIGACESFDEFPFPLPRPRLVQIESPPLPADEVTGIPGREAVLQLIRLALESFHTTHLPFGILCLEIDNPEQIRAKDGPIGLHQVLYATAQTLHANIGPGNLVGRWSEDRFIGILHGTTSQTLLDSAIFLKRLAALEAVPWWGDRLTTTLSVAGTMARPDDTGETLTARAEATLDARGQREQDMAAVV